MTEIIQSFFAIRHNPTSGFLPTLMKNRRSGHTFAEPVVAGFGGSYPRLFHNRTAAKIALTVWLKGEHQCRYVRNDSPYYDRTIPVPSRKREEMEIVQINLVLAPR